MLAMEFLVFLLICAVFAAAYIVSGVVMNDLEYRRHKEARRRMRRSDENGRELNPYL